MTRHLACSIAVLLALATTPGSGAATTAAGDTPPNVEILVNGVPQTPLCARRPLVRGSAQGSRVRRSVCAIPTRCAWRWRSRSTGSTRSTRGETTAKRRTQVGARPVPDRHHSPAGRPAASHARAVRVHHRRAVLRAGARQDRQPAASSRRRSSASGDTRDVAAVSTSGNRRGANRATSRAAATRRQGETAAPTSGGRRVRGDGHGAARRITPSNRCGSISRRRRPRA